jgi:hypothetical protein
MKEQDIAQILGADMLDVYSNQPVARGTGATALEAVKAMLLGPWRTAR